MNLFFNMDNRSKHAVESAKFNHFLVTGLGADWNVTQTPILTASASDLLVSMGMTFIEITLDGHTRMYTNLGICQFAEKSNTQLWYLDAGLGNGDYLSIGLLGSGSGCYSFGTDVSDPTGISIVTYGIGHSIYSSYYVQAATPEHSLLTQGRVDVELSDCSRLARLRFSGIVRQLDRTDSPAQGMLISGRLCLAC